VRTLAIALLMVGSAVAAQGQHAARDSTFGSHGMVLFGERGQFLSHLPLYRAPHDWQMLLHVSLAADSATSVADPVATLRADRAASGEVLYTIEPEEFAHSVLETDSPFVFRATVYRGHFERGGTAIIRGAVLKVERVLHRRRLHRDGGPVMNKFIVAADSGDAYLIHYLTGAPNFEQIVAVRLVDVPAGRTLEHLTELGADHTGPKRPGDGLVLYDPGMAAVRLEVLRQIYLEHGDLESAP
jgi:hypothetical protein